MENKSQKAVEFVKFNFDCTNLTVGIESGFKIYCLKTSRPYYEHVMTGAVLVERLNNSSLLAIVEASSPKTLTLHHIQKNVLLWSETYDDNIVAVHMNSVVMIVCLETTIIMYNIDGLGVYHRISGLPPSCSGLSILSTFVSLGKCFFVYPESAESGIVRVMDVLKKKEVTTVQAHLNPIAMMVLNQKQTILATASTKGTVIRLIALPTGTRLAEYRRGLNFAEIYSMTFSSDSKFLCCSFNTGTVHIFSIDKKSSDRAGTSQGWLGYLGRTISSTADYMFSGSRNLTIRDEGLSSFSYYSDKVISVATAVPTSLFDQWSRTRAFAVVRVPTKGVRCIAMLFSYRNHHVVLVASEDGHIYSYNFDPIRGGECQSLDTVDLTEKITNTVYFDETEFAPDPGSKYFDEEEDDF